MYSANDTKKRHSPSPEARTLKQLNLFGKAASRIPIYNELSKQVLATLTSMRNLVVLHIQPESFPDHLLRLHILLQTIESLRSYSLKESRDIPLGAVIVVDSLNSNGNGYKQVCWAASQRNGQSGGTKTLGGSAYLFGKDSNFAVVRGLELGIPKSYGRAADRLTQTIKNVMRSTRANGVVWHECATIALLAHTLGEAWRGAVSIDVFKAICMTNGVSVDNMQGCTIKPCFRDHEAGRSLLHSIEHHNIPLLLMDSTIVGLPPIHNQTKSWNTSTFWNPLANHLPSMAAQWPRLLPSASWSLLLRRGMDDIATSIFRLRAATAGVFEEAVVNNIKKELSYKHAQNWASNVTKPSSYTESSCRDMRHNLASELWNLYLNAVSPINFSLDALIGGIVDPGRKCGSSLMALRIDVDFTRPSIRVNAHSQIPTYILITPSTNNGPPTIAKKLNQSWETLIASYIHDPKAVSKLPPGVAAAWEDLAKVGVKNFLDIAKTKDAKTWSKEEKEVFMWVVGALWGREMTGICAASLGRHPFADFGK